MSTIKNTEREKIIHDDKVIKALVDSDIFIEGPYTASSGVKLPIAGYIERVFAYPKQFKTIIKSMARAVKSLKIDCIMGCAMVGVPFADAVAYELGIPMCPIRSSKSSHGVITYLAGTVPDECKNILLFDDWNGSWASVKKFYDIVNEYGIKPKYVMSIVESFEDMETRKNVSEFLEKEDLKFIAFCTFRDLIDQYLNDGKIGQELHDIMSNLLENPELFANDKSNIAGFIKLKESGKTAGLKPKTIVEKKFEIR